MQQVNLYTDAFQPKKVVLPLEQILLLPLVAIILLAGLTMWLHSNLNGMELKAAKLQANNEKMQLRIESMAKKAKLQRKDDSLVAANKRLAEKVTARQKMILMLDTVVVKDDEGFSNILLSLAKQQVDDLWFTEIHVSASGQDMKLEGITVNAQAVPTYLQKLRNEQSFIGRTFTLFQLDQNPQKSSQLNFSLRSEISHPKQDMLVSQFETPVLGLDSNLSTGAQP